MQIRDLKIGWIIKIVAIATVVYLILNHNWIWNTISAGITPVLSAFIVTYSLDYIVRAFEKRLKMHRPYAVGLTIVLFIFTLIVLGLVIVPRIFDAVAALIAAIGNINFDFSYFKNIDFNNIYLNEIQQSLIDVVKPMLEKLTNATGSAVLLIVSEIQKLTTGVISFVISLVIAIYMLVEKNDLIARIRRTVYAYISDEKADKIYHIAHLAHNSFKDFFLGKLLDSFIIGLLTFITLSVLKFEFAVLIAIIVGITNMIPYFGPFIGAVPSAIITYIGAPDYPIGVVWVLIIILIIQQLDGWVIGPFILGDSVGVSAFWIILAVTVGGATFGVLGMFLGVPVCVLIKTLIEEDVEKKLMVKGYDQLGLTAIKSKKNKSI